MPGAWVLACLALACTPREPELLVDVKTDLVPGVEFVAVRTEILDRIPAGGDAEVIRRDDHLVALGAPFLEGVRVADIDDGRTGDRVLRVALLDADGTRVVERIAIVTVRKTLTVTLVLARDCRGVACPGAGDDPNLIACLGGRCVDPRCTEEVRETCPAPACQAAAECAAPAASCAAASCVDGLCLVRRDDGMCAGERVCHPDLGCVFVPAPRDAALMDGAAIDAIADAGPRDAPSDALSDGTVPGDARATPDASDAGPGDGGLPGAPPYQLVWADVFGPYSDCSWDVAFDSAGNVYVTGCLVGSATLGGQDLVSAGARDVLLVAYDAAGSMRFARVFGSTGIDEGRAVATDSSGNVVLTGTFQGSIDLGGGPLASAGLEDFFVASFDTNGALRWAEVVGGAAGDTSHDVATDGAGNVYVAGSFGSTPLVFGAGPVSSAGSVDAFVTSYTPDGVFRWARAHGDVSSDTAWTVATDGAGNVYAGGSFAGIVDFGTGPRIGSGPSNSFLVSYDTNGTARWVHAPPNARGDLVRTLAVDGLGQVYATGQFTGAMHFDTARLQAADLAYDEPDIFVVSYTEGGTERWARRYGANQWDSGWGIAAGADGTLLLDGIFSLTVDFGAGPEMGNSWDPFVAAFDSNGATMWSWSFAGGFGFASAAGPGGRFATVGTTYGDVDFGGGSLPGPGTFVLVQVPR